MSFFEDLGPEQRADQVVWCIDSALQEHLNQQPASRALSAFALWVEDREAGVSDPIARTDELATGNPINDLVFGRPAEGTLAVGLSMPLRPVDAYGLDAESSALTNRAHLIVLADDQFSCRVLRPAGDEPVKRALATDPYSDLLRRLLGVPTPPPTADVVVGLAYDWILRCIGAAKSHRRLTWADLVSALPVSNLTKRASAADVHQQLVTRSKRAHWDDALRSITRQDSRMGWFDTGSISRSPLLGAGHRELTSLVDNDCAAKLRLVLSEISPLFDDSGGGQVLAR